MTQQALLPLPTKPCPLCCAPEDELPLSEFGICRARPDGRNLYCKSCIRKKVADSRRSLKEYRAARKLRPCLMDQQPLLPSAPRRSKTSVELVREAIARGVRTQATLRTATGLDSDQIGDALAHLLLWTREVKSQVVDNLRVYVVNDSGQLPLLAQPNSLLAIMDQAMDRTEPVAVPARKPAVQSGFASITELMPARITGRKVG